MQDTQLSIFRTDEDHPVNFDTDDSDTIIDRNYIFPLRSRLYSNRRIWYDKTWIYTLICVITIITLIILFAIKIFFF